MTQGLKLQPCLPTRRGQQQYHVPARCFTSPVFYPGAVKKKHNISHPIQSLTLQIAGHKLKPFQCVAKHSDPSRRVTTQVAPPPITCVFYSEVTGSAQILRLTPNLFAGRLTGAKFGDLTAWLLETLAGKAISLLCSPRGVSPRNGHQKVRRHRGPSSSCAAEASRALQLNRRPFTAFANCLQAKGSTVQLRKLEGSGKSSGSSEGC